MIGIFLNRKNLIVLLMAIELMLLAVNMNFVAFSLPGRHAGGPGLRVLHPDGGGGRIGHRPGHLVVLFRVRTSTWTKSSTASGLDRQPEQTRFSGAMMCKPLFNHSAGGASVGAAGWAPTLAGLFVDRHRARATITILGVLVAFIICRR